MGKKVQSPPQTYQVTTNFSQLSVALITFIVGSTVAVLLANLFFPRAIVLGNHLLSSFMGAFCAMSIISLFAVSLMPIIETVAEKNNYQLDSVHWLVLYWILNSGSIWLVGRFAELIGLGISSWLVAVVFGLVINLIQGMLMVKVVRKVG